MIELRKDAKHKKSLWKIINLPKAFDCLCLDIFIAKLDMYSFDMPPQIY